MAWRVEWDGNDGKRRARIIKNLNSVEILMKALVHRNVTMEEIS